MFRFTIRDMCWLVFVISIALGFVRERRKEPEFDAERLLRLTQRTAAAHERQRGEGQSITEAWHAYCRPGEYEMGLDNNIRHGGKSSAFIKAKVPWPQPFRFDEWSGQTYATLNQSFRAEAYRGQRLHLSGYLKTAGASGGASLRMQFYGGATGFDTDWRNIRGSDQIHGTADWQHCDIVVDVPRDAVTIECGINFSGSGQVWCDDLNLEVVDQDTPPTRPVGSVVANVPDPNAIPRTIEIDKTATKPASDDAPKRQLLFSSNRTGNFEIFLINEDGTDAQNLTNNPADDTAPAWSPDGQKIAFQSSRDSSSDGPPAIYVMDADGANVKRLTSNPRGDARPAWSPDGTEIAWCRFQTNTEIFVMDTDGTNHRNLTNSPYFDTDPTWSPDGRLAFTSGGPLNQQHLYVLDANRTNIRWIQYLSRSGAPGHAAWSPDGKWIAYTNHFGRNFSEIFVCDPTGNNCQQLTTLGNLNEFPAWSPDGAKIAFQNHATPPGGSAPFPPGDLYIMDADGTNPSLIVRGEANLFHGPGFIDGGRPAWKPK